MTYTTNLSHLEQNVLPRLGIDVESARRIINDAGPGFTLSYSGQRDVQSIQRRARTALYSWLSCLGVKQDYTIRFKDSSVVVERKITVDPRQSFSAVASSKTEDMSI